MNNTFLADTLISWYKINKRDLPWRNTTDPYLVWVSEIILQQTRVAQGIDYYDRFTERFPDIKSLAEASENEVLRYWQGLGYYSRARNMHTTAKMLMSRYNGKFPDTRKEILSLKGIGDYTASAICSFAFRQAYPAVDGNVYRFISRLMEIDTPIDNNESKKYFYAIVEGFIDHKRPDLFNQAIMEFGATQCIPKNPNCLTCPFNEKCLALANNKIDKLPVKKGKTKVRERYFNYLHIHDKDKLMIVKRNNDDIWKNLYELPLIETDELTQFEDLCKTVTFKSIMDKFLIKTINPNSYSKIHILSHRKINAIFHEIKVEQINGIDNHFINIFKKDLDKYPISRLIEMYFEEIS